MQYEICPSNCSVNFTALTLESATTVLFVTHIHTTLWKVMDLNLQPGTVTTVLPSLSIYVEVAVVTGDTVNVEPSGFLNVKIIFL
jgi:hypothetical protein